METITHRNRQFEIIEKEHISKYPNIQANQPNVEFTFIAVGKRGAAISGYILKSGAVHVFDK